MKEKKLVKLSRSQLYDLVWSTPMVKLAKEFGLSDVGLRKICRRHEIPTPHFGYWAKIAHGHSPKKIELPPVTDPAKDTVEISAPLQDEDIRLREQYPNVYSDFEGLLTNVSQLEAGKRSSGLHPLVKETFENLARSKVLDRYGKLS